jgi:hypothetical protein
MVVDNQIMGHNGHLLRSYVLRLLVIGGDIEWWCVNHEGINARH